MKKYLIILILMGASFLVGRFYDAIRRQIRKLEFKPNAAFIAVVAIAFLSAGILIGKRVNLPSMPSMQFNASKVSIISDFESKSDLKLWDTRAAKFERSQDHATSGKYSGKMLFSNGVKCSNVLIENYFDGHPSFGNWAGFGELRFDIYNSGDNTESLALKIKDKNKKSWGRKIYLHPREKTEIKISIAELKAIIDPSHIKQFNFYRWKPDRAITLYIDNIRLLPAGASEEKPEENTNYVFGVQNKDIEIGIAPSTRKVFLEPDKYRGKSGDTVEISLARHEYESAQVVIHAKKSFENVTIEKSDLTGKNGRIDKSNIKCYVVGYVKTKKPGYMVSHVGWWPDPLEEKPSFNIKENALQPIWVRVYAPQDTPAGEYTGNITLNLPEGKSENIKLKAKVWDFALPKETHLKTAFDFYTARLWRMYPRKEGESEEARKNRVNRLHREYYMDMIEHRIMPIFNFEIKSAFFAKDIKPYLDQGLSAFAVGRYGGSHNNNWPKDPEKLNALIDVYRDYASILKANNLIDKAYIYTYDEPKYGNHRVDQVSRMIHKADRDLKNMVCLNNLANPYKYPGWGDDVDIWCVRNVVYHDKIADIYRKQGKEIWIYVSGPETPYPTLVIDYPAMAHRIIPWMCWKYDISGYLYWSVNYWTRDPWQDPANTKWGQNGNGLLYYPGEKGPVTSIRLEVTRDGIEDYEYFYMLKQKLEDVKRQNLAENNPNLIRKAKQLLNIDESIVSSMADYTKNTELINNRRLEIAQSIEDLDKLLKSLNLSTQKERLQITEDFAEPIEVASGKGFGDYEQLSFELYRDGTFLIDGKSGFAWQKSDSYRDIAIIHSTKPLPPMYKISAVVGDIDYDLSNIEGLENDPEYAEGPKKENGCYLLAITDVLPSGHHTNDWWHEHRKVCIDVDNNTSGSGMPNPIFMVYFDKNNSLVSLNGAKDQWEYKWKKAVTYEPNSWYRVEIEKTLDKFIMRVSDEEGNLLKEGAVDLSSVWHEKGKHPDYLVIGDPHENYYQGSMKIKSISMTIEEEA